MTEHAHAVTLLTPSNFIAGLVVYVVLASIYALLNSPRYPTSIPWVGHGKGWLADVRNLFDSFTQARNWERTGYETYSKKNKAYVLPGGLGAPKEIIVPRSQMQWMLEQPDSVLSTSDAHYDTLHGDYSFMDSKILQDPFHERVIHLNLARNLNALIPDLSDEVVFVIDEAFGQDTQNWTSVNLMQTLLHVIPKLTNRMLVGKPLCRNQDYLDNCVGFTLDVIRNMLLFAFTPKPIKKLIGPLASWPAVYHFNKTAKYTMPMIQERLDAVRRKDDSWKEVNDYISWDIRTCLTDKRYNDLDAKKIAQRLLPINFASIHTTSMAAHSALLDVLSTDPKLGVLDALREEAERVFSEEGGEWTKAGLGRMYKTDSVIRESQRFSSFAVTLPTRKVVAPDGITNEAEGWHAPYGSFISCPVYGIHMDKDIHSGPDVFDPFRYSREREVFEAKPAEERDTAEALRLRGTGMVTTSDKHFPFGHGRHTCPGRFFVAHELKMTIAHLVMNYDLKYLDKRPPAKWVGKTIVPPSDARIEVRRREQV